MTDKELKKLSKSELLEVLAYMRNEIDSLKEENRKLAEKAENGYSEKTVREILDVVKGNSEKLEMFCGWLATEENSGAEQ